MTGRYPLRFGMNGMNGQMTSKLLPTREYTVAQELRSAGYRNYMVGKWHLGYESPLYTPTHRGFDRFFGYYGAAIDYWNKQVTICSIFLPLLPLLLLLSLQNCAIVMMMIFHLVFLFFSPHPSIHPFFLLLQSLDDLINDIVDLTEDSEPVSDETILSSDMWSPFVYTAKAAELISSHAENFAEKPMFMYFSSQLIHDPATAPEIYLAQCRGMLSLDDDDEEADLMNRIYMCAMVR